MKNAILERERIYSQVWAAIESNFKDVFSISITDLYKENKEQNLKDYALYLQIFHFVFNDVENGKIYLWNEFNDCCNSEEFPCDESDFSEDEVAFLKKIWKTERTMAQYENVNKSFFTDRLELSPIKFEDDSKYLRNKLVDGSVGEYELYTSHSFQ